MHTCRFSQIANLVISFAFSFTPKIAKAYAAVGTTTFFIAFLSPLACLVRHTAAPLCVQSSRKITRYLAHRPRHQHGNWVGSGIGWATRHFL